MLMQIDGLVKRVTTLGRSVYSNFSFENEVDALWKAGVREKNEEVAARGKKFLDWFRLQSLAFEIVQLAGPTNIIILVPVPFVLLNLQIENEVDALWKAGVREKNEEVAARGKKFLDWFRLQSLAFEIVQLAGPTNIIILVPVPFVLLNLQTLHKTTFCFVRTHLASGQKEGDEVKRNMDVMEILKKTRSPRLRGVPGQPMPLIAFWIMNYTTPKS
ncbi:uncharacterized protein LOC108203080 isoform X2 [Daucus carota subsp. sativus]|uniref:uncharacterized protein LOC108203080 isoform X2 n=1 Tax=Daucus carota subsp. sativus TaxID=79200 RepID=UPI003082C0DE